MPKAAASKAAAGKAACPARRGRGAAPPASRPEDEPSEPQAKRTRVFGTKRPRKEPFPGGDGRVVRMDTQAEYSHKTVDGYVFAQRKETCVPRKPKEKGASFCVVTDPVNADFCWTSQGKLRQLMPVEKMLEVLVVAPFEDTEDLFAPYEETFYFHMHPLHTVANLVKAFAHRVQLVCPGYIPALERMQMDRLHELDMIEMQALRGALCITQKTNWGESPVDYVYYYLNTMRQYLRVQDEDLLCFRFEFTRSTPRRRELKRAVLKAVVDGAVDEQSVLTTLGNLPQNDLPYVRKILAEISEPLIDADVLEARILAPC